MSKIIDIITTVILWAAGMITGIVLCAIVIKGVEAMILHLTSDQWIAIGIVFSIIFSVMWKGIRADNRENKHIRKSHG